jgi:translation initiation factor IF-3
MGMEVLGKIAERTQDVALVEQMPKFEARTLFMILAPK